MNRGGATRIVLAYLVLAGLWIIASDRLVELAMAGSVTSHLAQTIKGMGFVAITGLLLYGLLRRQPSPAAGQPPLFPIPKPWIPLATYGIFAIGLVGTGFLVFQVQRDQIHANAEAQLRAVGELRVQQIDGWLRATLSNGRHFGHGTSLAETFATWLRGHAGDTELADSMRVRLYAISAAYGYSDLTLHDTDGRSRLAVSPNPHVGRHRDDVLRVIATGKPELVDYHQHAGEREPTLGVIAPLELDEEGGRLTVGALYFSIPARSGLFTLIERWPTPTASGETLVLRPESTLLRVLFASRHPGRPGPGPLLPLWPARLSTQRLATGEPGVLKHAVDLRGVPVLAYSQPIAEAPWVLMAKLDQSEVDAPVDHLARITAVVVTLLLVTAGLAFWLWWRNLLARQRALQLGAELERQRLLRRFEVLSRHASDVILLTSADGTIIEANERVLETHGYHREELLGRSWTLLLPDEHRQGTGTLCALPPAGMERFETESVRKDGSRLATEVSAHGLDLDGVRHGHLTLRDISDRKLAEAAAAKANAELLEAQRLARLGHWVYDTTSHEVTWSEQVYVLFGLDPAEPPPAYEAHARLFHPDDLAVFQQDVERALTAGISYQRERRIRRPDGSLRIYLDSGQAEVDASGRVLRLFGTAQDITERKAAEFALAEREALYRAVIETSADGFCIVDSTGGILEVNDAYCRRSGFARRELLGMRLEELEADAGGGHVATDLGAIACRGSDLFESVHRSRDGTPWQVEVNISYSPMEGGRFFLFLRDIQARHRSEALLRTRMQLSELALHGSLDELLQAALDAAELSTGSRIGFFHFVDAEEEGLTLQTWSTNTLKEMCSADCRGQHHSASAAGVWADCVRDRRTLTHNDYAGLPWRNGLPEGHAPVVRELLAPVLRHGRVVAVIGVGNKSTEYTGEDTEVLQQLASMAMDMVARKQAEEAVVRANARLIEAQRIAQLGDWEYDLVSGRGIWSEQVHAIAGSDPARDPPSLATQYRRLHPDDRSLFRRLIRAALEEGTPFQQELRLLRDGDVRYIWADGRAEVDPEGRVKRLYGTVQDITTRKQVEARLDQAMHNDHLTGLPNARQLLDRLQQAMTTADAEQGRLALLVLDIDRFAQLNESLGRTAGDEVLVTLSRRWAECLPETALLARVDGDHFAVLWRDDRLPQREGQDALLPVIAIANDLLATTARPIGVGDGSQSVSMTLSAGIAIFPGDGSDAASLLHAAEDATRHAKADRGNQTRFYDRRHAQTAIDWFDTETALRHALEQEAFFLVYQPQVDISTGRVVAAEALIRWQRDGQVIPPGRFIAVVEGTDLAEPVSRWVLRTACRQARVWQQRHHALRVAVNIFSDHVTSGHLLDDVRHCLELTGLAPALLELEVVESSLLKNPEAAARTLREIKRLGVGLALDDFGTGYSSLGYLKHYPFDVLKIDQLFSRNVTRDPEDAAIVRSTIALAHNLGMRILAEGVETEPQLRFLTRYGCDQIQGYLLARPTSPEALETLIMERRDLRPAALVRRLPASSILIVEDEPVEAERLAFLLKDEGYRTHAVATLDDALAVMGSEHIDLIVSDQYLPDGQGVELLERLRRLFPDVPRIMVSGTGEQAVVVNAVNRAGIRAFLHKPVAPDALLHAARSLLREAAQAEPAASSAPAFALHPSAAAAKSESAPQA